MRKEMIVGAVFLAALAVTGFGTIAVSGLDVFTPREEWFVEIENLNGLKEGDEVRMLGHRIGVVDRVKTDFSAPGGEFPITVVLKMEEGTPIFQDYNIQVRDKSALGGKFLAIHPGKPSAGEADIKNLRGDPTTTDVMGGIADVLGDFKKISTKVAEGEGTLGKVIVSEELYADLRATSKSLRTIADRLQRGEGTLGRLLTEEQMHDDLREVAAKLNKGDSALAKLLNDESGKLVDDLLAASANVRSITAKIDKGEGTAGRLVNDGRLYDNAAATLASVRGVADDVRDGKGVAGLLLADNTARSNVRQSLANVRVLTENVRQGRGTIGKAMTSDELYHNFNDTARNLSQMTEKLNEGRGTIGKLINDTTLHEDARKMLARAIDAVENGRDSAPVQAVTSFLFSPFQ
jgi:phospholipid/cholesterol/gamma-HCH transport system substrate-binding protein